MTPEQRAIEQHLSKPRPEAGACGCLGADRGEPLCPCDMAWVEKIDNNYYRIAEQRSTSGIKHTATLLGPVGGPYIK